MNYSIVFRLLGLILMVEAIAFTISLGIDYFFRATSIIDRSALGGFGISIVIAFGIGIGFSYLGRQGDLKMFRKEALCVIGLGWILASLVGALPFFLIIPGCTLADAIFESTSGLTTTGASVFTDLEKMPHSLLFWRSLSQWMGGLGVVVFFVAILAYLGAGAKILFSGESSAHSADLDSGRVQTGVLRILGLYVSISAVCVVAYWLCGLDWFEAFCHMFATVATGGFSTRTASVEAFQNPLLEWMIILFMALGGTSFIVMLRFLRGDWSAVRESTETGAFYLIMISGSLLIAWHLIVFGSMESWQEAFRMGAFQVVSIITTTGFATTDFDSWAPFTHIFLLFLMLIGGSSGSTAGGLKVIRIVVGIKVSLINIERAFRTRVVRSIKINGKNLDRDAQENVISYLVLVALVAHLSVFLVVFMEPLLSVEGAVSTVLACLFSVGPGFQEIGPAHNYAFFHDYTKCALSLIMIMGRLEMFAVLVLFSPSLWRSFS